MEWREPPQRQREHVWLAQGNSANHRAAPFSEAILQIEIRKSWNTHNTKVIMPYYIYNRSQKTCKMFKMRKSTVLRKILADFNLMTETHLRAMFTTVYLFLFI